MMCGTSLAGSTTHFGANMRARYYTPIEDMESLVAPDQVYEVLSEFTATWRSPISSDPDEDVIFEYGDRLVLSHLDPLDAICYFRVGDDLYWAPTDDILEFCKLT